MTPEIQAARTELRRLIEARNVAWRELCNASTTLTGAQIVKEIKTAVAEALKARKSKLLPFWRADGSLENYARVVKALGGPDAWNAIRDRFTDRARAVEEQLTAAHRAAKEAAHLQAVALTPLPGTQRLLLRDVWISTYSSQGFGAASYARNEAKLLAADAEVRGLKTEIVPTKWEPIEGHTSTLTGKARGFEVYVFVEDPIDLEILKLAPALSLREQVRLSWKHGSDPRVSMPFLPWGYEEANDLDFFGNDLRLGKAPAVSVIDP